MNKNVKTKDLPVRTQDRSLADSNKRIAPSVPFTLYQKKGGNTIQALRAVIYVRVSTQEQAQKKASIPDQLERCHKIIDEKGWTLIQEYKDEGISGHLTVERHGLQSMLRDAREHKFDLIVVKDYDRFARDKDAAGVIRGELKELSIQTYALNTPFEPKSTSEYEPDEDQMGTMVEAMSDLRSDMERKAIIQRMKMGKMRNAQSGNIPNRVPYGYEVHRELVGSKIKRTILVNEEKATRVRFIYNEYARGVGDRKIVIEMNRKGWPAPGGGEWNKAALRYILSNPTYMGKVWWGWRHAKYSKTKEWRRRGKLGFIGDGNHPKIIDPPLFNIVQEIRAGRQRSARGGSERSFGLLTGIAKCIRCGSGVGYQRRHHDRSRKNPKWRNTVTHEYICTGYKYKGICSSRVMSAIKLESEVLNHIKNIYSHPKVQEKIIYDEKGQDETDREKEIIRLEREIAMEPVKMERQHDAYEKGITTIEEYEARVEKIREEIAKSRMERDHLVSLSSLTAQKVASIQKLVASMRDFDTAWEAMELDERKMILRSIIKEIRAGEGKVEIDFIL